MPLKKKIATGSNIVQKTKETITKEPDLSDADGLESKNIKRSNASMTMGLLRSVHWVITALDKQIPVVHGIYRIRSFKTFHAQYAMNNSS